MTSIRLATGEDADAVRAIALAAFGEEEGSVVSEVAVGLLAEESDPPVLSLLASVDDKPVGFVCFSPLKAAETGDVVATVLAPVAVHPEQQRRGIARSLIARGFEEVSHDGPRVVLVYGDPAFYGRFGFTREVATPYVPPYPLQMPEGWQGLVLPGGSAAQAAVPFRCVPSLCDASLW